MEDRPGVSGIAARPLISSTEGVDLGHTRSPKVFYVTFRYAHTRTHTIPLILWQLTLSVLRLKENLDVFHLLCNSPTWVHLRPHSAQEKMVVWCHHAVTGPSSLEFVVGWKVASPHQHLASASLPLELKVKGYIEHTTMKKQKCTKNRHGSSWWTHWWADQPAGARCLRCRQQDPVFDSSMA